MQSFLISVQGSDIINLKIFILQMYRTMFVNLEPLHYIEIAIGLVFTCLFLRMFIAVISTIRKNHRFKYAMNERISFDKLSK